jgi:hypothetical protein
MLSAQISEEKRALLGRLAESERTLVSAAESTPEDCAGVTPAEDCWSVLEVLEHITLSDRRMWKRYLDAGPNTRPVNLDADRFIEEVGHNRSARRSAPQHVLPTGQFGSLVEALSEYRKTRGEIAAFVEGSGENFREKSVQHPVTEMDGHQLFLLIAAHSERHARQIDEIKNSAVYQAALKEKAAS